MFFRPSANGAPQDGAGPFDQGFYFDDLTTSVYNSINGTGNSGDNIITGNSGDNVLTGGGGNDTINAGAGYDTIVYNVAEGGSETVDGGAGVDTQVVNNNTANSETYNINAIDATHLGINIELGFSAVDPATSANAAISDTNVEELVLNLGSAGDVVVVSGDLNGTGLATSTITVHGGAGSDIVDASLMSPASPVDVVFTDGGGNDTFRGGSGADTIIYNVADHGRETVDGGTGTDTQVINIGGVAETFNINPFAGDPTHLGVNIEPGAGFTVPATPANYAISDTGVEEIVIQLSDAGDQVVISGDLGGTGVATSTITVNGGTGFDLVYFRGVTGTPVDIVFNGGGGDDLFKMGLGNDTFTDTGHGEARISEFPLTTSEFSYSGGKWIVTRADGLGTDTLQGVSLSRTTSARKISAGGAPTASTPPSSGR